MVAVILIGAVVLKYMLAAPHSPQCLFHVVPLSVTCAEPWTVKYLCDIPWLCALKVLRSITEWLVKPLVATLTVGRPLLVVLPQSTHPTPLPPNLSCSNARRSLVTMSPSMNESPQ